MENKKLGITLLTLGILILFVMIYLSNELTKVSEEAGCFQNEKCIKVESGFSLIHASFGIIGFVFALGFYLLLFNKTENAILKRLEDEKNLKLKESKFDILLKALDEYEQKVMKAIKEQDGITQATLRIRTDLSKAKLSYVVNELERRGLIRRIKKGKTLAIFLKE